VFHNSRLQIQYYQTSIQSPGESIGLLSPDEGIDGVLDQVIGHQEIGGVLQQISTLPQDAETLKAKYGVEIDSTNDDGLSPCIEVSGRRRDIFKQHYIVDPSCGAPAKIYY